MKNDNNKKVQKKKVLVNMLLNPGYPLYPAIEDSYSHLKEESEVSNDSFKSDLKIPSAELDAKQEQVGSEGEENNL